MKTFLFIDGTNLYAGQYELFGPKKYLCFPVFVKEIEKQLGIKFSKIHFYASYSPKPKKITKNVQLFLKNEAFFYKSVKKTPNIIFFRGYRSPTSGKEKEVDVKLAVDIVDFSHRNKFDKLYLLSGDADFHHALFVAKSLNKHVELLCLQNKVMHRASYHFRANILVFSSHNNRFTSQQKIVIVKLNANQLTQKVGE